jgi:hypothetical protein
MATGALPALDNRPPLAHAAAMSDRVKIEIDAGTTELLEARAKARGLGVADLLANLAGGEALLPPALEAQRQAGEGAWAPDVLVEDARRLADFRHAREALPWDEVKAWMQSWGTAHELPPPKARKV